MCRRAVHSFTDLRGLTLPARREYEWVAGDGWRWSSSPGRCRHSRVFDVVFTGKDIHVSNHSRDEYPAVDGQPVEYVSVHSINRSESLRLAGESAEHAHLLAESDAVLPPIVVHRDTMRVIDGVHRVRAALIRGDVEVPAVFYDGSDEAAYILAVQANVLHGLPRLPSSTGRPRPSGSSVSVHSGRTAEWPP